MLGSSVNANAGDAPLARKAPPLDFAPTWNRGLKAAVDDIDWGLISFKLLTKSILVPVPISISSNGAIISSESTFIFSDPSAPLESVSHFKDEPPCSRTILLAVIGNSATPPGSVFPGISI